MCLLQFNARLWPMKLPYKQTLSHFQPCHPLITKMLFVQDICYWKQVPTTHPCRDTLKHQYAVVTFLVLRKLNPRSWIWMGCFEVIDIQRTVGLHKLTDWLAVNRIVARLLNDSCLLILSHPLGGMGKCSTCCCCMFVCFLLLMRRYKLLQTFVVYTGLRKKIDDKALCLLDSLDGLLSSSGTNRNSFPSL